MARPDGFAVIRTEKGRHFLKANVLIGADGRSTSAGSGITDPLQKEDIAIGVGHHYHGDHGFEPGMAECWLGSRTCPGEYAYVLPSKHEVTVVTTFRPHLAPLNVRPSDFLQRFLSLKEVKERLEGTEKMSNVWGSIPVKAGGTLGKGKVLLAGEAARTTDPMLGFGMKNAIISGYLAGLSSNSDDPLFQYVDLMRSFMTKDLSRRMVLRRRMLDVIGDDALEGLVGTLASISRTIHPDLFDRPGNALRVVGEFLRSLPLGRDTVNAVRYLIPFALANYSMLNPAPALPVHGLGKGEINRSRSLGERSWETSGTGYSSSAPIRAP
jgi:flavin-dependent dehydrogenase